MAAARQYLAVAIITLACQPAFAGPAPAVDEFREAYLAAITEPGNPAAGAGLKALLPRITTSFGPPRELFIVEGDLALDEHDLDRYRLYMGAPKEPADPDRTELIVHIQNGQLARWPVDMRTLRYSVLRATFPDNDTYRAVVDDMRDAGQDWVDACKECKISFVHRPEYDAIGTWE
jgi:hypothetical protein